MTVNSISHRWLVFFAVGVVALMINLDISVVNLALASIAKDFHTTMAQMQWIVNIYMLTNIIFIIFAGKLADVLTKKPVYLWGIAIFLCGSVLAGFSFNQWMLIFARAVQGVGFAFTLTLGILIVTFAFPENRRGFILGCYMTVAGLSQAIGPTVGGIVLHYFSWRFLFLFNVPLSILALVLIAKFFTKESRVMSGKGICYSDLILLSIALSVLIFSLNKLGDWGFCSVAFISMLVGGLLLLMFFYLKEKQSVQPLVNFKIFSIRNYLVVNIARFIYMYGWISILFCLPLFLQNVEGKDAMFTGLLLFCMTALFGLLSPIVGLWLDKVGYKTPLLISVLLSGVSFILFANLHTDFLLLSLVVGFVLFGISSPIMGSASAGIVLKSLPIESIGVGMGMFYTLAFFGSTIGVSLSGSLINLLSVHHFEQIISSSNYYLLPIQINYLQHVVNGVNSINAYAKYFSLQQMAVLKPVISSSFLFGLSTVMWINATLSLFSAILCYFLINKE